MAQLETHKSGLQAADVVLAADLSAGAFTTAGDGLPGYATNAIDVSVNALGSKQLNTIAKVEKTANIVFLIGQEVYFDRATGLATYDYRGNDYMGLAVRTPETTTTNGIAATGAASYVYVHLGAIRKNIVELGVTPFTPLASLGLGVTASTDGVSYDLEFDAVAEAAYAGLLADDAIDVDDGPIVEMWVASKEAGDNAALDRDWGLISASPTTDVEAIAAFVAFHLDNDLDIDAHSDDGTTDVALADTTINATDDTYAFYQACAVDKTAPVLLVNGIQISAPTTMTFAAFTGDLYPFIHMEKTSDDTIGKTAVRRMKAYAVR